MDSLPPPKIALLVHAPSPAPLFSALATLLEPSESLKTKLAPEVHEELARRRAAGEALPNSYGALLTLTQETINKWDVTDQQDFIASHPRIGETKQLSKLSEKEQGDQAATGVQTPGHVLKRLIVSLALSVTSHLHDADRHAVLQGAQQPVRGFIPGLALHHVRQRPLARRDHSRVRSESLGST